MMTIGSALRILKKYGYNSINNHPYLYIKGNDIGINYSYVDDIYGVMERVAIFNNDIDMDIFLKKFQWYKSNKNKVSMRLNDYEIPNPVVYYVKDNHVITDTEIFKVANKDDKKISYKKRLVNEISNLLDRYYLKKEEIERYINNYLSRKYELKRYYIELQKLINKYNHIKWNIDNDLNISNYRIIDKSIDSINIKLLKFKNKDCSINDIQDLLNEVWLLNRNLELNKDYIDALTYDNNITKELILVNNKVNYMKELLSKKKVFKENLIVAFDEIDNGYNEEFFNENEVMDKYYNFVTSKYDVLDKINHLRLTEYLNDFISNKDFEILKNIERCRYSPNKKIENYNTKKEKVYGYLTTQFNKNLSNKERATLILYTSIYHDLFSIIMNIDNYDKYQIKDLVKKLEDNINFKTIFDYTYTYVLSILNLSCNAKIKKDYFNIIDFKNKFTFIDSIRKCIRIMSNINKLVLKDNMRVFLAINNDNLNKDSFLITSSNISQIIIDRYNTQVMVCNVKRGINVLFSPFYLKMPNKNAYNQSIELLNELNPYLIFDTKDVNIKKDNNKIFLSKFRSKLVNQEDFSYVDEFKIEYKIGINEIFMEKGKNK